MAKPDGPAGVRQQQQQDFSHEEEGYSKGLGKRQLQMIAIGGAIGTGLFLGAGGRLASAGPALAPTPGSSTARRRRSSRAGCTS